MFNYQIAIFLAATIVIPCYIGAVNFAKFSVHYKFIVVLLIVGFFTESILFILPYWKINNLLSLHIYSLVEIILLSQFFIHQFKNPKDKRATQIIMIGLAAFALVYSLIGNNIAEFNSIPRALECIYFSALSCYLFYELAIDTEPANDSIYFLNGAIMFYFSSCFIVFAFSKYQEPNNSDLLLMHNIHSIVSAMCNLAYAAGLWIASRSSYSAA